MASRQPRHERESHAHSIRSTGVKRRRERRDRLTTASWCRSAMISRCSETRDPIMNRSEWMSEKTTDATKRGYRRTPITSIDATPTMFLTATIMHSVRSTPQTAITHKQRCRTISQRLRDSHHSKGLAQQIPYGGLRSREEWVASVRRPWRHERWPDADPSRPGAASRTAARSSGVAPSAGPYPR